MIGRKFTYKLRHLCEPSVVKIAHKASSHGKPLCRFLWNIGILYVCYSSREKGDNNFTEVSTTEAQQFASGDFAYISS